MVECEGIHTLILFLGSNPRRRFATRSPKPYLIRIVSIWYIIGELGLFLCLVGACCHNCKVVTFMCQETKYLTCTSSRYRAISIISSYDREQVRVCGIEVK